MATQHGFWIDATDNRVFDGIVTRHLIAHGDIVAINAFYQSPAFYQPPAYSFADIVRRLKAASSAVRVLFYTWAGRKRTGADMIGAVPTLDGWESQHPDIRLMDSGGHVLTISDDGREFTFLDPRKSNARDWLTMRVREVANLVGSDGVALDGAIRSPDFLERIENPEAEPRYPAAFDFMIRDVTSRTPLTIFNNLSARPDQEHLLGYAHGASIERFGLNDLISRQPTFAADILPYLDAIGRHPDRTFLVFGRASRNEEPYTTYEEDWRWQRYLYCAYLLRAGANTRWKQHAGFLTSPSGGRAGGLEVYSDVLHDIGAALGDYSVEGGCYRRAFERGLVLVVPFESTGPVSVLIEQPMFTPEGAHAFGNLIVTPGEGKLLLWQRPDSPRPLGRVFDHRSNPLWQSSGLRRESSGWYLHLEQTQPEHECEHDLALDLVRYRVPRGVVTLSYRTSEPSAHVETVVEVDDTLENDLSQKARFVLVDGSLDIGHSDPRPRKAQFRAGTPPPGSQFAHLPVIGGGTPLKPDGQWQSRVIDLDAACTRSGRYTFHRALFMRLVGSLDIKSLRLHTRPIPVRTRAR